MTVYRFNGEDSYISLPPIPDLEDLIKGFSVDFWLQTDCKIADGRKTILVVGVGSGMDTGMVFHIGLNWHHDFEEHIRLYIRDASNRVLECVVLMPYSSLTTGNDLHHIKLEVISLEENKVSASINGELMERVQFLQVEHPVTFNKWISPVFLGGQLDDDRVPLNCFRGTICDLRICSHEKKPILVWPLNGAKTENDTLFESTGTIPAYHQEIISNVEEIERPIQDVVPVFDGVNTILNMGHMGCFGNFLNRFHIEFKFRTTQTKRVMSLFGVTDSQYSMCEVGLILNAEPSTIGNTRYRYNEYNITFYIIDCNGMCLSALIRGSERNNVMDGKWHTISLKLIDSETNQLDVTINGLRREVIVIVKECPKGVCYVT